MVKHCYIDRLRAISQEGFHAVYTEALMPNLGNSHRMQDPLETTQSSKPALSRWHLEQPDLTPLISMSSHQEKTVQIFD